MNAPRTPVESTERGDSLLAAGLKITLAIAVLGGALIVALGLIKSAPAAHRKPPPRRAHLVETYTPTEGARVVTLSGQGQVRPAEEVTLQAQVSGVVTEISDELEPGGLLAAGEAALKVERRDYELAVRRARAAVAQAKANLEIERGNQNVARAEYKLLGEGAEVNQDLILRKPHLAASKAQLDSANADLARARLDLKRATVKAPFDAVVQQRGVAVGARVGPGVSVATLVGTRAWWVEVGVPVDQLRFLDIPTHSEGHGSAAVVRDARWPEGQRREGRIIRLAADVDPGGRLARVIVEIPDPLALTPAHQGQPKLLLGAHVSVRLQGASLEGVVPLPRRLLHGDDKAWLLVDGRLVIRPVRVLWRGPDEVLISEGLAAGEAVITTQLSAPVAGMTLRTEAPAPPGERPKRARAPRRAPQ